MTTVRDIVTGSLRLIGVVQKSEPIAADEAQDGLERLNEMIASWANDSLMVFARSWENFALTPGQSTYTIGTGGDFNTVRPTQIISAYVRLSGSNIDYPLNLITDDQYALEISIKNLQSNIPYVLNYDNGYPLAKIRVWMVPSTSMSLYMQMEKQVASFASLDDVINLPPGWLKAIRYNLAVELAPEYNVDPSNLVLKGAEDSKAELRSQVLANRPLTYMNGNLGYGYSVYGDVYYG
jgi:hypothetical protein